MKRPYTDVLGNEFTRAEVSMAIEVVRFQSKVNPVYLHRPTRWGIGKASNMLTLLGDAGVLSRKHEGGFRSIILRDYDQALNAALRQLKKGRR